MKTIKLFINKLLTFFKTKTMDELQTLKVSYVDAILAKNNVDAEFVALTAKQQDATELVDGLMDKITNYVAPTV